MAWWPEHRETVKMERNYTKFKSNCNLKARKGNFKIEQEEIFILNLILVSMDQKEKQREKNFLCPRHDFYFMAKFKYITLT